MTDTTAPKLINFQLPTTIDLSQPGAKIPFKVEAADEAGGSGLSMVVITLDRFVSGGNSIKHVVFRPGIGSADGQLVATDTFTDATPTTASIDFNVGAGSPAGTVRVVNIKVIDQAGMVSTYTGAQLQALGFNSTVELVNAAAPVAPTASLVTAGLEVGSTSRTLAGTSQPGNKIFVAAYVDGLYKNLGSTVAGADGKWTLMTGPLSDGIYTKVSAWAVDADGNASTISQQFAFDVWKDGLSSPTLSLPTDAQGLLRVDNPVVTGTGVPQATVTVYADGKAVGTAKVDDGGFWSVLTTTLSAGAHTFTASQATAGGRTSALSEASQATVAIASTGLKFSVSGVNSAGVNADRGFVQNMLDDTAARFSEFIDANVTIPVSVTVKDMGTAVGAAGANFLGVDASGTPIISGAILNLSSKYPSLYSASESANPYLYAHEMLHVLGFNSDAAAFKKYLKVQADGLYFVGPNAVALNGAPVRLDAGGSHIDGDDDLMGSGGGNMNNPVFGATNPYAPFSQVDIAILKDLGWNTKPILVSTDGHTFIAGSGKAGFDQVKGTASRDLFFVDENRSNFSLKKEGGSYKLVNNSDLTSHTLTGIERIQFSDKMVAIDIDGAGGQIYRLYQAAFGRVPDTEGLGFWMRNADNGMTLAETSMYFSSSDEFKKLYGTAPTVEGVVTQLYQNVLHRAPEKGGFDFWVSVLQRDFNLLDEVLAAFSESPENVQLVGQVIGNGFEYTPFIS